jgi:hypothetical protein
MNKAYIIERDVLTEVWVRQKFTIEAPNEKAAIDILKKVPEDKVCTHESIISIDEEILNNTKRVISSQISVDKITSYPYQPKLTFK